MKIVTMKIVISPAKSLNFDKALPTTSFTQPSLLKESKEVQQAIRDKAARTTMAYNKGPIQYFSPESDTTMLGSSSRRG